MPALQNLAGFLLASAIVVAPLPVSDSGPAQIPGIHLASPSVRPAPGAVSRPSTVATAVIPTLEVAGTVEQRQTVGEAVTTFAALGLALPELVIRFWDDTGACNGHMGLFRPRLEVWTIEICSTIPFVLPHELAHAWERAALTDADREVYLAARGLDTWINDRRGESGREDVALVIQLVVLGGGASHRSDIDEAFAVLVNDNKVGRGSDPGRLSRGRTGV